MPDIASVLSAIASALAAAIVTAAPESQQKADPWRYVRFCGTLEGYYQYNWNRPAHDRDGRLWRGSTLDRFLGAVPDAAVQVVPLNEN